MDFYLIVIFSDRIQQHVRVFTLREESAARCFKGSSTGWISRCVCWLLMSFSTRQQAHRGGGAWQRLSRVWALICCVVGPIWTHSAVIWWNPRAWWTTAHSCNVELNVKLNDFCSPSIVLTGKYMLKETKSQGIHLKTKLRRRKLVGRTNSCFFTFPSLLRGKSFRQRWAMIPAARASPRTLIMVRNLSLQRRRGQETLWDQNCCWKY